MVAVNAQLQNALQNAASAFSAVGSVSNPEVRSGISAVLKEIKRVRDLLSRLVNKDLSSGAELALAAAAAQQSTTTLATLCTN